VSAVEKMPEQRPLDKGVAEMPLHKGRFDVNLTTFVEDINMHRFRISDSN